MKASIIFPFLMYSYFNTVGQVFGHVVLRFPLAYNISLK